MVARSGKHVCVSPVKHAATFLLSDVAFMRLIALC